MADYKPALPFNVPALLISYIPTKANGTIQSSYEDTEIQFSCSAKSYGGTEKVVNGLTVIEDTWQIDTWYNPVFKKRDRIRFLDDNTEYEILASPENINRRGQYMRFKARKIGG